MVTIGAIALLLPTYPFGFVVYDNTGFSDDTYGGDARLSLSQICADVFSSTGGSSCISVSDLADTYFSGIDAVSELNSIKGMTAATLVMGIGVFAAACAAACARGSLKSHSVIVAVVFNVLAIALIGAAGGRWLRVCIRRSFFRLLGAAGAHERYQGKSQENFFA